VDGFFGKRLVTNNRDGDAQKGSVTRAVDPLDLDRPTTGVFLHHRHDPAATPSL
jgi:hypothetical protein